jgi:hypothetical protein
MQFDNLFVCHSAQIGNPHIVHYIVSLYSYTSASTLASKYWSTNYLILLARYQYSSHHTL